MWQQHAIEPPWWCESQEPRFERRNKQEIPNNPDFNSGIDWICPMTFNFLSCGWVCLKLVYTPKITTFRGHWKEIDGDMIYMITNMEVSLNGDHPKSVLFKNTKSCSSIALKFRKQKHHIPTTVTSIQVGVDPGWPLRPFRRMARSFPEIRTLILRGRWFNGIEWDSMLVQWWSYYLEK